MLPAATWVRTSAALRAAERCPRPMEQPLKACTLAPSGDGLGRGRML